MPDVLGVPPFFPIVRKLEITATTGLMPPPWAPGTHPLWWAELDTKKAPPIIRFSWLPVTGELRVGVQCRHALQIPRNDNFPFSAWLRGFSFPQERCLVIRTYFWPVNADEAFDAAHARLDLRVARSFLKLVRPFMPPRTLVFDGADNEFLRRRFSHLADAW
jgi:hypothetical protein